MKLSVVSTLGFGLILLLALNQYEEAAPSYGSSKKTYVTLLYGDESCLEFVFSVRLQAEGKHPAGVPMHYSAALNAYLTIVRQEGVMALWTDQCSTQCYNECC